MKKYLPLILIALFLPLTADAAISVYQNGTSYPAGGTSCTISFSKSAKTNDLLWGTVQEGLANTSTVDTFTASDTLNGAWTPITYVNHGSSNSGVEDMESFYFQNSAAGADSVTFTTNNNNDLSCFFVEVSGAATSSALDAQATSTASSLSNPQTTYSTASSTEIALSSVIDESAAQSWVATGTMNLLNLNTGQSSVDGYQTYSTTQTNTTSGFYVSAGSTGWIMLTNTFRAGNFPPTINSFGASPSAFYCQGGTTTLSWNVTGDASDTISGIGSVATGTASTSVYVGQSTTFTLTSQNAIGTSTASVTIPVYSCGDVVSNLTVSNATL